MTPISLPIAELKSALVGLGKIIPKRPTLPVLGTVRIERNNEGWIALTGTDLDHRVTVRLEQPGAGSPALLLVPYEDLLRTCKACGNGGPILVEGDGNGTATLKYRIVDQLVETKVESLPVAEFPPFPRIKGEHITISDTLRTAIREAFQCASNDPTRHVLNGACIDVSKPEANYVVGTDGRHLFSSNSFTLPLKESLIIPTHKFLEWKEFNHDGEWQMKVNPSESHDDARLLQISSRRWRFIATQIAGSYPNWRQVIPDETAFSSLIQFENPDMVADAIEGLPDHDDNDHTIGIERVRNTVQLLWKADKTQPWSQLEVSHERLEGTETTTFLNRNYLIKALRFGMSRLQLTDAASPMRFSREGGQMIVMPVRSESSSQPASVRKTTGGQTPDANNNLPPSEEQPKEESMQSTNCNTQQESKGPTSASTDTTGKSALENAMTQFEIVRREFRNALAGLNKFGESLKQLQRENKANEKEISSVRATLRSLQTVRI